MSDNENIPPDGDDLDAILNNPEVSKRRLLREQAKNRRDKVIRGREHQFENLHNARWDIFPQLNEICPELGRRPTEDEHFTVFAMRLKRWGNAVRAAGWRALRALDDWKIPDGIESEERQRAEFAIYVARRAADASFSADEIEGHLRRSCTDENAHLLDALYLPACCSLGIGWLARIHKAIEQTLWATLQRPRAEAKRRVTQFGEKAPPTPEAQDDAVVKLLAAGDAWENGIVGIETVRARWAAKQLVLAAAQELRKLLDAATGAIEREIALIALEIIRAKHPDIVKENLARLAAVHTAKRTRIEELRDKIRAVRRTVELLDATAVGRAAMPDMVTRLRQLWRDHLPNVPPPELAWTKGSSSRDVAMELIDVCLRALQGIEAEKHPHKQAKATMLDSEVWQSHPSKLPEPRPLPKSIENIADLIFRQRATEAWTAASRLRRLMETWEAWLLQLESTGDADAGLAAVRLPEAVFVCLRVLYKLKVDIPAFRQTPMDAMIQKFPRLEDHSIDWQRNPENLKQIRGCIRGVKAFEEWLDTPKVQRGSPFRRNWWTVLLSELLGFLQQLELAPSVVLGSLTPPDDLPTGRDESRRGRRGRKADTNAKDDARIFDGWKQSGCRSFEEYSKDCGRTKREIEKAVDRHEKRLKKAKEK